MALPKQVQQQIDEVAEIERAMLAELAPAIAEAVQTADAPEIPADPAVITAAEPEQVVPAEPAAPPTNVVELKPAAPEPWEQRYLTLKGMYDKDVPSLHAQVKDLKQTLATTVASLDELKKPPVQEPVPERLVTDQDEQEYGKELIDLTRRVAKEALTPLQARIDALVRENSELRKVTGETGSQVATLTFEQRLTGAVPDFEAVNNDPKWIAWLDEVDPILRGPRRMVASDAYNRGDVEAVKAYVDLFKQQTHVAPAADSAPAVVEDTTEAELRSQVTPSRTTSSAVTAPSASERLYSEKEASTLYDKVSALNRSGKYDEASKLDAELTLAYNSGRVR